jgi:hypothetical protein
MHPFDRRRREGQQNEAAAESEGHRHHEPDALSIDQCADGEHAQAVAEGEHGESGGNLRPCPAEFRGQRCAEQIEHHRHDIDAEDQRDEAGNDMAP